MHTLVSKAHFSGSLEMALHTLTILHIVIPAQSLHSSPVSNIKACVKYIKIGMKIKQEYIL